jgi:hypothetical protein
MLRTASRILRVIGGLLVLLGLVHLTATPHIARLLEACPPDAYARDVGPTVLNHVLVGFLLLPLGATTWMAAGSVAPHEPLARRTLLVNALAVVSLPVSIAACMRRPEYYESPLFLAGVALVAVVSLLAVAASVMIWMAARRAAR